MTVLELSRWQFGITTVYVVTGIVQEFQFGMNWSAYSRFVGNVFGAPLAMAAPTSGSGRLTNDLHPARRLGRAAGRL